MKRLFLTLLLLASPALAQQPPFARSTVQTKVTVAVTNTYIAALSATPGRVGCLIENLGAHTEYVFFGAAAPADTTTSWSIAAGNAISCAVGGVAVANDAIWLTGTAGDTAAVSYQ